MKRLFDVIFSIFGILLFFPFFLVFSLLIILEDGFPVFYRQERVGKNGNLFTMLKLRSMKNRMVDGLSITIGERDSRILKIGYFIRKYKLDEFAQLLNVLIGDMSLVGPRPEVSRYVEFYSEDQKVVLSVRPGITDVASIEFRNENALLEKAKNPEAYYVEVLLPKKIGLNMKYINDPSLRMYFSILVRTILALFK